MASFAHLELSGRRVRLEPLSQAHVAGLVAAASESRETYGLTIVPDGAEAMGRYVQVAVAERERGVSVPFATVDLGRGAVVGSTRFMNIETWTWPSGERAAPVPSVPFEAAEIGSTWLAASAQRTTVNTEVKLLMLTHAFDVWGLRRVNLKTDARNARSRTAIERLDGILRAQLPASDGGVRDTALYSILAGEWPAVKAALAARIER